MGEQCEAIVKFPVLIERFPFPVVINSAFLKIADVFRTGYVVCLSVGSVVCPMREHPWFDDWLRSLCLGNRGKGK